MKLVLATAPALEPITLDSLKLHLRHYGGSLADNIDETQSIAPGSKAIANNYTTHVGTAVDVLGYTTVVILNSGTNEATGTVDCKIQESDDNVTFTDWTGGAFTQVTTANDNAIQELAYSGSMRYIRTVAKVLLAACVFGTTVIRLSGDPIEDDLMTDDITTAREHVEDITRRAIMTSTWDYYLDAFPSGNSFKLPLGNLQSVTHIKYTDSDATQTTMTVTTDYIVETNGEGCGRIVLPYGESWPSFTAYPSNPIVVRFVAGWTTRALVPSVIKSAIKLIATDIYFNRDAQVLSLVPGQSYVDNPRMQKLLSSKRLWEEF